MKPITQKIATASNILKYLNTERYKQMPIFEHGQICTESKCLAWNNFD